MKTRTLIIIAIAFLFCPKEQKAQSFTTGINAGISTNSVSFSNIGNSFVNNIQGKDIIGYEFGLSERLNLGVFYIKPMVLISYHSGTINYYNNDGSVNSSNFDYGNIEVPLMFGLKILGPIRIEAGPVYNWIYTTAYNNDDTVKINPSGLGYRVGANIEFGMINLGLAYQGLTNTSSGSSNATFSSPNELIFSVALCFGGEDESK